MLRRTTISLAAVTAIALSFAACGGDSDSGGSSGSGGTGATDGGGGTGNDDAGTSGPDPVEPGRQPPADPGAPPAAGTDATVVALYELFVGDTDRTFAPDATAWKSYGFNLDGIISTKGGTNHCKPQEGANPSSVKTDGDDGIDNSFGANLVPLIGTLASDLSQSVTDSIQEGSFTIMIKMDTLEAGKPDQSGIPASLYGGAELATPPVWDGTQQWPVISELLNGGNIDDPKVKFGSSYVAGGTWVSGGAGTLNLTVAISGYELGLQINKAQIAMDITGAGSSAQVTNGTIAGVIETEQLITELKKVVGNFEPTLCNSDAFNSIADQIRQASDMMADGTNGDDSKTCDGISIGLGFTARPVMLGDVAPVEPPPPDPCATN